VDDHLIKKTNRRDQLKRKFAKRNGRASSKEKSAEKNGVKIKHVHDVPKGGGPLP